LSDFQGEIAMRTSATGVVERAYLALWLCDMDGDDHTTAVILDDLGLGTEPAPAVERGVGHAPGKLDTR
jgi:hypothetical protein